MHFVSRSLALVLAIAPSAMFAQGALLPAGLPAPSMKTLAQIEPRTPIDTLPGDADSQYVISQSGSYYLTGNLLGVVGKNGIKVTCINVTIDLNGFMMQGVNGCLNGIVSTSNGGPLTVQNGTIQFWGGAGVTSTNSQHSVVRNLAVLFAKSGPGIKLGDGSLAENVTTNSTYNGGILLGAGSTIRHCTVDMVNAIDEPLIEESITGLQADVVVDSSVRLITGAAFAADTTGIRARAVENCAVSGVNAANATNAMGIDAQTVRGCSVDTVSGAGDESNGINGTLVADNFVRDVSGGNASGIRSSGYTSTISRNRLLRCGISAANSSHVADNTVVVTTGIGILVAYTGSRIEGNTVNGGSTGIQVTGANNLVVRNFVSGSATKYSIAAGNQAVVAVVSADDITTASPWANFSQP